MNSLIRISIAGLLFLSAPIAALAQQSFIQNVPPPPGQLWQPPAAASSLLPGTVPASALTPAEKFNYRVIQSFGWQALTGSAISAGIDQWQHSPRQWRQRMQGYSSRYSSTLGADFSRQSLAWGLESGLREDPRYIPSTEKTNRTQRLLNALKQVFLTKKDSGNDGFAYSRVISAFGAAQLVNAWQPKGENSFNDGLARGGIILAGDAIYNVLQEFIPKARPPELRDHKPSAPTTP